MNNTLEVLHLNRGSEIEHRIKLKCSGWEVLIAWAVSCVEALALRKLGMSMYTL